jgi:G6PDH family F420-dependent oxidoreductase
VVNAPIQRYHPAVVAQAAATLAEMYAGRFWLAVGSGEALNEHVTGEGWPTDSQRNERLKEAALIIKELWRGSQITHTGYITIEDTRLYTLPDEPPPLIGAALTPETAEWMAPWVDGIVTVNQPLDKLRSVVDAFHRGGGEAKSLYLQVHLAYGRDEDALRREAHDQWRTNVFGSGVLAELRLPEQFEAAARYVRPEDLEGHVLISSDADRHIEMLSQYVELGFERLYIHHVGRDQSGFIQHFGRDILPQLSSR